MSTPSSIMPARSIFENPADRQAAADVARRRKAWTDYLQTFEWDHFCTLTSAPTVPDKLRREYQSYVRRLTRVTQGPVPWFYTLEHGYGETAHLHLLLAGTRHLSVTQVRNAWQLGFAQVRRYDPSLGAAYYVTKDLTGERGDYDLSNRRPRLRANVAA